MSLYQNKYRIEPARLQGWNYAQSAAYFITICTKDRINWFGAISVETPCMASLQTNQTDGSPSVQLTEIGWIVQHEWLKTPSLRPDMNLLLDAFVVMPNHFHAILFIGDNEYNCGDGRDAMHGVSTEKTPASTSKPTESGNHFGPQSKNLGSIIRGFKSAVTTKARHIHPVFSWQERYHDHIIRNNESFLRIQQYIINNPSNWIEDKFFTS